MKTLFYKLSKSTYFYTQIFNTTKILLIISQKIVEYLIIQNRSYIIHYAGPYHFHTNNVYGYEMKQLQTNLQYIL